MPFRNIANFVVNRVKIYKAQSTFFVLSVFYVQVDVADKDEIGYLGIVFFIYILPIMCILYIVCICYILHVCITYYVYILYTLENNYILQNFVYLNYNQMVLLMQVFHFTHPC